MVTQELINQMIPPLKPSDKAKKALSWMEELRVSQLPVVFQERFLGFISEESILEQNDPDQLIEVFELEDVSCTVQGHQHFFDAMKIASDYDSELVTVLDPANNYLGVITIVDTISAVAQTAAVQSPGGILVLSMQQMDYSLAEIARLIESDNAKIIGSSILNDPNDPSKIKLTLKINKVDLTRVIATLERFGYVVVAKFQEEVMISNEKERLDILLKFLDI